MNLTELRQNLADLMPTTFNRYPVVANPSIPFVAVDHPESIQVDSFATYQVTLPLIVVVANSDPNSGALAMNDALGTILETLINSGYSPEVVSVSPISYGNAKALGAIINTTISTR